MIEIALAVGLAQNFAALKALAGDGIQKGHMKLHLRNMAIRAGANDHQLDEVVRIASEQRKFGFDEINELSGR